MAVRSPNTVSQGASGCVIVTWTGLLNGDTGDYFEGPDYTDKTVQVTGTFGAGGTVAMQGSNLPKASAIPASLHRPDGATDLNITDTECYLIGESPRVVRPSVPAGDGTTNLTVTMVCNK